MLQSEAKVMDAGRTVDRECHRLFTRLLPLFFQPRLLFREECHRLFYSLASDFFQLLLLLTVFWALAARNMDTCYK